MKNTAAQHGSEWLQNIGVYDMDQQETKKEIKYIQNPLPGPKPHVKKEMTYDYKIAQEQMHFDIENPDRNYYDYE